MSEISPSRVRGQAMSISTVCLWCGTLIVTITFLSLVRVLTAPGAFLVYAFVCVVAALFVWLGVPETKGRSLEEIEACWSTGR
jgi:sugar phosphate permease